MRTTMDRAGRVVIPKELRDAIGLVAGPVDLHLMGGSIQIEVPEAADPVIEDEDGRLVIAETGSKMTDDDVRELRLALHRR